MNQKKKTYFLFLIIIFSQLYLIFNYNYFNSIIYNKDILNNDLNNSEMKISNGDKNQSNLIVFFNKQTYNNTVKENFTKYGGSINKEWNNTFNSISGFAGILPNENISAFQANWPDATIENDEIIETQMNYATIQTGAINSSWYLNGYKGNTNSSIAILDSGINPYHNYFPNGYNQTNLSGNIIGWQDFINSGPISDEFGHGTFISSIIAGTGTEPYNSSSSTVINLYGYYSH